MAEQTDANDLAEFARWLRDNGYEPQLSVTVTLHGTPVTLDRHGNPIAEAPQTPTPSGLTNDYDSDVQGRRDTPRLS